jgi:hypothetical protein
MTTRERKSVLCSAVRNMDGFLREMSSFEMNYEAFTNHAANFRYDTIHEIFSRIGIEGVSRSCLMDADFIDSLCQKHSIEGVSSQKLLVPLLMRELDDLAQRRNQIAHGARIDDIESVDLTISRINLIKEYVKAIDLVVTKSLEIYTFSVSSKLSLGKATKIFPKMNVIGFSNLNSPEHFDTNNKIVEGDLIFAVNNKSSERVISGRIVSLRVDDIPQTDIALPCNKSVSIGVNFTISDNFQKRFLYVVSGT